MAENVSQPKNQREQDRASIESRELDNDLVSSMNKKIKTTSRLTSKCCIYKVPHKLRAVNKKAYVPDIVSIGPHHHGRKHLRAMEEQKWHYVKSFLSRNSLSLKDYVNAVKDLEERARNCYAETIKLSSNEFVQMMIVDGCFIIELFSRFVVEEMRDKDDPIFSKVWMFTHVKRDLILLENQVPLFVLESLVSLGNQISFIFLSNIIAFSFVDFLTPKFPNIKNLNLKGKHILDLVRNCLLPTENTNLKFNKPGIQVPCAMELRQAGIKFKEGLPSYPLDIKFNNGVIELLHLRITDSTDSLLRNLIAFEQLHSGCTNHLTSYAFLMDNLINSSKDVEVLRDSGILDNWLGKEEDISRLFNELGSELTLTNFSYSELCKQVNTYYGTKWHKWQATLTRDYFNSPWTVISFVAAVLLLICTFIQTGNSLR